MQEQYDLLDCVYPPSFLSHPSNGFFARLSLLSRDVLLTCVRKFRERIPKECQTKAGYVNLIESDFARQTNELIRLSNSDLLQHVSVSPLARDPTPQPCRFSLVCQFVHNRYGAVVASQLLCSQARWNPPEVPEDEISQLVWLQTPLTQLRSRLAKVDTGTIKACCDLYFAPSPAPNSKTGRCNAMVQRFRARSLYLVSLSDLDFAKEYFALLPQNLPGSALSRNQLVEALLRAECSDAIAKPLMSSPNIADARQARGEYLEPWPQVISKDIIYGCLNAYHEGSQWKMPLVCFVCSRRQHGIEMHSVAVNVNEDIPEYFQFSGMKTCLFLLTVIFISQILVSMDSCWIPMDCKSTKNVQRSICATLVMGIFFGL